jgi:hypothetical protein
MTETPSEDREKQFKEMGFLTFAWILGLNHVGMSNWDGMGWPDVKRLCRLTKVAAACNSRYQQTPIFPKVVLNVVLSFICVGYFQMHSLKMYQVLKLRNDRPSGIYVCTTLDFEMH